LASLSGARGYESMEIVANEPEYTSAFSCEYVRLRPGAHSVTHVEEYNHLLFFVEGSGEITIGEKTWDLRPGSYAKVKAGAQHSLRNLSDGDMLILPDAHVLREPADMSWGERVAFVADPEGNLVSLAMAAEVTAD
jgi:quercetin dioxygenase-like cupin family protein